MINYITLKEKRTPIKGFRKLHQLKTKLDFHNGVNMIVLERMYGGIYIKDRKDVYFTQILNQKYHKHHIIMEIYRIKDNYEYFFLSEDYKTITIDI